MIIFGHIEDNQILIDKKIQLPDGIQVEIRVPDEVVETGLYRKDHREAGKIVEDITPSKLRPVGIDRGMTVPPSFFYPLPDDLIDAFQGDSPSA